MRRFWAALWFFFFLIYIFAKVDFFTQYSDSNLLDYIRQRSIYWAAMAAIALLIWLVERPFPRKLKPVVVIAGSVLAFTVICIAVLHFFASEMCANRVAVEAKSPDNRYKAVIFERDCGATTDFSTQVSILLPSQSRP